MKIRLATTLDVDRLYQMLRQVQTLHANGRPDIFVLGTNKYDKPEILRILSSDNSPVFVAVDENDIAIGYAFCEFKHQVATPNLRERKTFYLDDLCVDENFRGQGIGKILYEYVVSFAKTHGCASLELNVWHLNQTAVKFYQKLGMSPLKTTMEQKL